MALFDARSWNDWIAEYATSHQHPINRVCHKVGIPMIVLAVLAGPIIPFVPRIWWLALGLFLSGWTFQLVGHVFERKPPEFLKDWRFLFVGLRWWVSGR
jgi:uncharacterized membrane protein YGL010W